MTRSKVRHGPVAELLRSQPGVWHLVSERPSKTSAQTMARGIREGLLLDYRPVGSFESQIKVTQDDPEVWARYLTA